MAEPAGVTEEIADSTEFRPARVLQIPPRSSIGMLRLQLFPSELMRVMSAGISADMVIAMKQNFGVAARILSRGD
jgi:hypothetical protein